MPPAWLASYPKSGNTWVRLLLGSLQQGKEPSLAAPGGEGVQLSSRLGMSGDLDAAEAAAVARRSWNRPASGSGPWRKTHHAWVPTADGFPLPWQPDPYRAVYIVRDPRAVAVSWSHHLGQDLQSTVTLMATDSRPDPFWPRHQDVLSTWSNHVRSWLDDCELPLLLVRYEDLLSAPEAELTRVADWLDVPHTPEKVAAAVDACSFTTLAAREIFEGFSEAAAEDRAFFRRGEAEAWREELPDHLAELVCEQHAPMMQRLGYLD